MLPDSFNELLSELKISSASRILIAVSGGLDSVVLTHLIAQSFPDVGIAHMNFQLRDTDADADEQFVGQLANQYNCSFFTEKSDTRKYAKEQGLSIQMAARELRYDWFSRLMTDHGYEFLMMAHHLNDALETSLFQLAKGGGIAGLRGIPVRSDYILRPLITTSRDEIQAFAQAHQLVWREDKSNLDESYQRNFIRHQIVPALKRINPSLESTYAFTRRRLEAANDFILAAAEKQRELYQKERDGVIQIDLKAFSSDNIALAEALLRPFSCNYQQIDTLLAAIRTLQHPVRVESGKNSLVVDRTHLVISPKQDRIPPLTLSPHGGEWTYLSGKISIFITEDSSDILIGKWQASFDFDLIAEPLLIRQWEQGDRIRPLGMRGKKKVSDLMIDEKIPLNLKERVCVITSGDKLVWVPGLRMSDHFKVRATTRKVLNIIIDHD